MRQFLSHSRPWFHESHVILVLVGVVNCARMVWIDKLQPFEICLIYFSSLNILISYNLRGPPEVAAAKQSK